MAKKTKYKKKAATLTKQIEEAEDLLSLAIEIHPAPATRLMLVNVYLHQKEHTLVLAQLDAYLKENPDLKDNFVQLINKYMRFLEKLKLDDRFIVSKGDRKPKVLPDEYQIRLPSG